MRRVRFGGTRSQIIQKANGKRRYENDFYAWADEQPALLRAGDLDGADIAHIAEEIASLGRCEKRELVSRLTVLLLHLLKWRHRPNLRGSSWRASFANARDDVTDHLAANLVLNLLVLCFLIPTALNVDL
jgi:hypothetical protein